MHSMLSKNIFKRTFQPLIKNFTQKPLQNLTIYTKPIYQPECKITDDKLAQQLFKNNKQTYFNLKPSDVQDFLQLAEKYSRSYYTKIPIIGQMILQKKFQYENYELNQDMKNLMGKIVRDMPKKSFKLQMLLETFEYPRKLQYPKLITEFSKTIAESQNKQIDYVLSQKIQDFAYVLENINIALFLHNTLDNLDSIQQLATNSLQKKMISKLSDKKLILIGDFYHVKASLESSKIGLLEIPMYMSTVEEEYSKGICFKSDLKEKIQQLKDNEEKVDLTKAISIQDIYDLAYYNTACIAAYSFMATSLMIFDSNEQKLLDESYRIGFDLGLAIQFQRDIHKFVAIWPATLGQLLLKPEELYSTGINLPNYALVQCHSNNKNIQEVNLDVLRYCDMHIENLKQQAKQRLENLGGDFSRIDKLFNSFLNQI